MSSGGDFRHVNLDASNLTRLQKGAVEASEGRERVGLSGWWQRGEVLNSAKGAWGPRTLRHAPKQREARGKHSNGAGGSFDFLGEINGGVLLGEGDFSFIWL